jgi:homoserine kinase type II
VLAEFHYLARDFDSAGLMREQPPIVEFVRTFPEAFSAFAASSRGAPFDDAFIARLPRILEVVALGASIEEELEGLPRIPVHCDYHPGNLKWVDQKAVAVRPVETAGSSCSGLFDFDWSRLDKAVIFVRAYQEEAGRFDQPGAMNARELALLPRMIANANLYVLNWDLAAYYEDPGVSVDEYLTYLDHQLLLMEYIESHLHELGRLAAPPAAMPASPSGVDHDQERG